jgi:hypothetical protein
MFTRGELMHSYHNVAELRQFDGVFHRQNSQFPRITLLLSFD